MKNGGPAFPIQDGSLLIEEGMSLRDYFAAKAMQSFMYGIGHKVDTELFEEISTDAYRMADAMLAAREQENE